MATGHVEKRGKKWQVVLELGRDSQGKRIRKYVSPKCETRKEATTLLAMKIAEIERGEYIDPEAGQVTVETLLEQWLNSKGNIKPTTRENYEIVIESRITPRIGSIPLSKLTPLHIEAFKNELLRKGRSDGKGGLSSRSVEYTLVILKSALEKAVDWELISRNPARNIEMPDTDDSKDVRPFTVEQSKRIMETVKGERLYAAFVVLLATGIRRGELLGLRRKDILWKTKQLYIRQALVRRNGGLEFSSTKNKQKRKITVSENVLNVLRKHLNKQNDERLKAEEYNDLDLVFCRPNGDPINPSTFTHYFTDTIMPKAGITNEQLEENETYNLHSMRHTTATLLLKHGYSMKQIQEILGHTSITTTMDIYTEVDSELEERAAMELDRIVFG